MANEPTSQTTAPLLPLAPPADAQNSRMVKNPISLIMEMVLIFYMFLVTLYFKMFRVFLPRSKKSVKGKVVLVMKSVYWYRAARRRANNSRLFASGECISVFFFLFIYTFFAHYKVLRLYSLKSTRVWFICFFFFLIILTV